MGDARAAGARAATVAVLAPRSSVSGNERRRPKDALHLTRLKHLELADQAEGAPRAPSSFPHGVAAQRERDRGTVPTYPRSNSILAMLANGAR